MLTKKFIKTRQSCQVTFKLPKDIKAQQASLVGEFNNWDATVNPLKKVKSVWKTTLELEQNQEYQFRYLVNGEEWYNDDEADKYVPNNVDGENSVVVTASNNN